MSSRLSTSTGAGSPSLRRAVEVLIRVPRPADFHSRLRGPAIAARVGLWLGICFGLAFVTGVISHLAQQTPGWLTFPTRPVSLYRVTQGVHVIAGTMAVPLLLVKLWSVFPRLFERLDLRDLRQLTLQAAERGSIAVLIAAAIFELSTGLANSAQWYPWGFEFVATHYAVGWLAIGALLVHVAVKLPVIRSALTSPLDADPGQTAAQSAMSRRVFLRTAWLASGTAALATAGATVPLLRNVSIFGVRSGDGPQGIPINKSAIAAGVTTSATDPAYRLTIANGDRGLQLDLAQLRSMRQSSSVLPIACVEGWSASGEWRGIRVRDLLDLVDAPTGADVEIESLQKSGAYRLTQLPHQFARDPLTLLALELNSDVLSVDHGFPCRIIAPARPGVLQTKWVSRIQVLA
jgi:Oxidoreductase molybdopterin binding domain